MVEEMGPPIAIIIPINTLTVLMETKKKQGVMFGRGKVYLIVNYSGVHIEYVQGS
jgi:hypothetical protein